MEEEIYKTRVFVRGGSSSFSFITSSPVKLLLIKQKKKKKTLPVKFLPFFIIISVQTVSYDFFLIRLSC